MTGWVVIVEAFQHEHELGTPKLSSTDIVTGDSWQRRMRILDLMPIIYGTLESDWQHQNAKSAQDLKWDSAKKEPR